MKRYWMIAALVLVLLCCTAQAVELPVGEGTIHISAKDMWGEQWMFLPAFADRESLFPGAADIGDGFWEWTDENGNPLYILQSENLRALFLLSDDPVNEGREFVENCLEHENQTTGSIALVDAQGHLNYAGDLRQLRGRGNGTWHHPKRPYQIKLEKKADLLNTGNPDEVNRTWVLLAEATDGTLLHNKLAFDLGLELGMEETSHSEFVDLYYDGDYRGTYLLAEKVEVADGRIEGRDYDDLIEEWNQNVGVTDFDSLPVGYGENSWGEMFTYIKGVQDSNWLDAGTYLLEMESPNGSTLSDRCWFRMRDDSTVALKSPENASEEMVRYISDQLTMARETLVEGGVNSRTGRTIEQDFDVDAFARLALINELAYNLDGFTWSSTWFVLREESDQFRPGTAWDFDLAWRYLADGTNENAVGVKDKTGWLPQFYQCKPFSDRMYEIYRDELYPMITDILLGENEGEYLKPLDRYAQEIEASAYMNGFLWEPVVDARLVYGADREEELALLEQFITQRSQWLHRVIVDEHESGADGVELSFDVIWGHPDGGLDIRVIPWSDVQLVSCESTVYEEATEESYAIWQVEMLFEARDGMSFEGMTAIVNGQEMEAELLDDGRMRLLIGFEDPSYRPVDYYGEDIGLIYNPDIYAQNYPEIAAQFEGDPEGLMNYFCDEGMYENHKGNAFFCPSDILLHNTYLEEILGTDWQNYYWEFLTYGHEDGWLINMGYTYKPEVWSLM